MMKTHILKIVIIAFLMVSCNLADDFLDVLPKGKVYPSTVEHFDKILNNPEFNDGALYNFHHTNPYLQVADGDLSRLSRMDLILYNWTENPFSDELDNDSNYVKRYTNMYAYNFILELIDDAPLGAISEEKRGLTKGEALAQRAMDYFLLVNEYGPGYNESTRDELAIPMPLVPNTQVLLSRVSVGTVYDQILSDLTEAEALLGNAPAIHYDANFRPGLASVKALHALVSLHMGDFETAKTYSNEALALYSFVYDFTTMRNAAPYYDRPWWGIDYNPFQRTEDQENVMFGRDHTTPHNYRVKLYNSDLLPLYDKVNDKRWTLFSNSTDKNGGIDYLPNYAIATANKRLNAGMTTNNLMLINAEAKARTGDYSGARAALDMLLVNRIIDYTSLTSSSLPNGEVLDRVKLERVKEFVQNGINVIDLKRYHAYGDVVPTFTRVIEGVTVTLAPGASQYTTQIAQKVIELNPNLKID